MISKKQQEAARRAAKRTADKYFDIKSESVVTMPTPPHGGRYGFFSIEQVTAISAFLANMPSNATYGSWSHDEVWRAWTKGINVPGDFLLERLKTDRSS
jgi:hypothetical protein